MPADRSRVTLKLFNLIARELGPGFLAQRDPDRAGPPAGFFWTPGAVALEGCGRRGRHRWTAGELRTGRRASLRARPGPLALRSG
ncbi:MAG: hypothetical protein MZV70_68560 [Desulfobacterales bacterium]|nr:hypothetical protein [Desulfobacterales bacterium]